MKDLFWNDADLRDGSEKDEERLGQCPCRTLSHVDELLSRSPLTEQEVLSFLALSTNAPTEHSAHQSSGRDEVHLVRDRMRRLRYLLRLLPLGRTRIDFDGRLVLVEDADHWSSNANNSNGHHFQNRNNDRAIVDPPNDRNDELVIENDLLLGPLLGNFNDADDDNNNQAREEFLRHQHQDAAKVIQRLLATRYKDTHKHSLQLISITTNRAHVRPRARLTFRRICCAVTAVVTAFVCIMIRSLPSDPSGDLIKHQSDTILYKIQKHKGVEAGLNESSADRNDDIVVAVDALLHRIAKVRLPTVHIRQCGSLRNRVARYFSFLPFLRDCSDGVLQVPAVPLKMIHSSNDVTWHFSCPKSMGTSSCLFLKAADGTHPSTGPLSRPLSNCFRGIHDDVITDQQIADAITLGLAPRSDHFDIQYDITQLPGSIIDSLYDLLTSVYHTPASIKPVAFRVYATAPRNGDTTYFTQTGEVSQHPLLRLLNRKFYLEWVGDHQPRSKPHFLSVNDWLATTVLSRWVDFSQYLRRGAYSRRDNHHQDTPIDHCRLLSDVEVNEQFQIHSSIFLNDDFSGGAMLFVDRNDESRLWERNLLNKFWHIWDRKVQRGTAVYGRTGRVIVSSGDNQRCGLPVRKGIRAVLQIWWQCS